MALQALSEYAILSYVGGVNLTISLASTNLDFQETFELNRDNKKLLQSAKVAAATGGNKDYRDYYLIELRHRRVLLRLTACHRDSTTRHFTLKRRPGAFKAI